jgi:uncharacterized coiled-coil protein SlyX
MVSKSLTKSPMAGGGDNEERERSRSPRSRFGFDVKEPNPGNPVEVMAACSSLGVGLVSMVGALKSNGEKMESLLEHTQALQTDLVKSMKVLGDAITEMAHSIESLSGGVAYNTSRVGALSGEVQKIRKHIEWGFNRALSDLHKENLSKNDENTGKVISTVEALYEGLDKFQENLREIVSKMEEVKQPPASEDVAPETGLAPAIPPTGFSGTPTTPNMCHDRRPTSATVSTTSATSTTNDSNRHLCVLLSVAAWRGSYDTSAQHGGAMHEGHFDESD